MNDWRLSLLITGVSGVLLLGCFKSNMIQPGMTPEQVIAQRGKPDRIAVLEGKLLRTLLPEELESYPTKNRVVFIYDQKQERIWFQYGRVAGVAQDETADLREKHQTPEQARRPSREPQTPEK